MIRAAFAGGGVLAAWVVAAVDGTFIANGIFAACAAAAAHDTGADTAGSSLNAFSGKIGVGQKGAAKSDNISFAGGNDGFRGFRGDDASSAGDRDGYIFSDGPDRE